MLHDLADLVWKTTKSLLNPQAPQGTEKVRDQMATYRSYQRPQESPADSPQSQSTECPRKSEFSRSSSHESGGNSFIDHSGHFHNLLPPFFSTTRSQGIISMKNDSDKSLYSQKVVQGSSESLGIESSAGHRLEILLLVQIGLWTDVFISPQAYQYALVVAIRAVALALLLTTREIECTFSNLEGGSAGFGLVVCAKSLLQALEKQREEESFGCSLPLYKGTLHRMGETLAVSYRWQEEQVMLNTDFDINMREFQLRALADAIRQSRARYVWLDKLSVPQHKCILKNTLLARMMAVYAAAHTTLVIRTAEEEGSRYHERAWTFQEYCCCRRLHVVTEPPDPEDGRSAVLEDEEAEFADLRRMMQASISDVIPFWLSSEQIDNERARAVLETHRHLSMQLTSTVEGDKVRALTPLLTYTPVENQKELVSLVIQLSNASGEDLQDWKDALFDSHICNNGTRSTRMLHKNMTIKRHNKHRMLLSGREGMFDLLDLPSPDESPQIRDLRRATSCTRLLVCDGLRESDAALRTATSAGPGHFKDMLNLSIGGRISIPESDAISDEGDDFGPPSPLQQQAPAMAFLKSAKKAMTPSSRLRASAREAFGSPGQSMSSIPGVFRTGIVLFDRIDSPGGVGGRDLVSSVASTYTASRLGSSRHVPVAADGTPTRARMEPLPGAIPGSAEADRHRGRTPGITTSGRKFWGSPSMLKPLPRLEEVEMQGDTTRKCLQFGDEEPGAGSSSIGGAPTGSPSLFRRMMRSASKVRLGFEFSDHEDSGSSLVRSPDQSRSHLLRRTLFDEGGDEEEAVNLLDDRGDAGECDDGIEDLPRRQLDFEESSEMPHQGPSSISIDV